MKNIIYTGVVALCLLTLTGCKKAEKNVDDYFPEVNTVSAIVNTEGDVEVTGHVGLKSGTLDYIGFCMDTLPSPNMMSNQQIVEQLIDSEFKTVYAMNYNPAKTYYFRSWAASGKGYSYGNVIQLTNIKATPVVAPCTLNENSISVGLNGSGSGATNSVYDVSAASQSSFGWQINCDGYSSSDGEIRLTFGSALKTKVFTTTADTPFGDLVSISVTSGFTTGRVNSGSNVYVNKISEGVFAITICDATWKIDGSSSSNLKLNAKFKSPF